MFRNLLERTLLALLSIHLVLDRQTKRQQAMAKQNKGRGKKRKTPLPAVYQLLNKCSVRSPHHNACSLHIEEVFIAKEMTYNSETMMLCPLPNPLASSCNKMLLESIVDYITSASMPTGINTPPLTDSLEYHILGSILCAHVFSWYGML